MLSAADLGDHIGVPIDGPVDAIDVLLGRATYNSGMAINRRPHAAFSAHAADPMASTTPASSSDSNTYIHATTPLDE
jgi:hypothetical protein